MAIKLFGKSITSAYKSVVSTVSKNVSKVMGGSSSKSSSTKSKSSSSGNKTSGSSKSSSVSKVSSTTKQSTTTKYVTNAAAIYNASGKKVSVPSSISTGRPAQSYATQAKTSTTNNQKIVKTASGNKTVIGPQNRTTNSAISTGRPKESYISQQKASTAKGQATAQAKLPVPVAQKAPTSKKDPSEASYSNNRPKQSYTHVVTYKPSPSREGAGQMVYTTKTEPKGAKAGASFATSCIPYVGDAKDIQEAVTGKDLITGKKLTGGERAITITAAVLPVVSSPMLKGAAKGGKVAVKKAGTFIKKNTPEVKNVAKNTDVAKDTEKAMKKKAIEKTKDIKKAKELNRNKSVSVNGKKVIRDNGTFDPEAIDKQGRTNIQRMEQGLAPIGTDGKSVNIHHIDQTDTGPVKEITATEHQKSYSILHENTGQLPSNINRGEFNKWRKGYWEWRSNNLN